MNKVYLLIIFLLVIAGCGSHEKTKNVSSETQLELPEVITEKKEPGVNDLFLENTPTENIVTFYANDYFTPSFNSPNTKACAQAILNQDGYGENAHFEFQFGCHDSFRNSIAYEAQQILDLRNFRLFQNKIYYKEKPDEPPFVFEDTRALHLSPEEILKIDHRNSPSQGAIIIPQDGARWLVRFIQKESSSFGIKEADFLIGIHIIEVRYPYSITFRWFKLGGIYE